MCIFIYLQTMQYANHFLHLQRGFYASKNHTDILFNAHAQLECAILQKLYNFMLVPVGKQMPSNARRILVDVVVNPLNRLRILFRFVCFFLHSNWNFIQSFKFDAGSITPIDPNRIFQFSIFKVHNRKTDWDDWENLVHNAIVINPDIKLKTTHEFHVCMPFGFYVILFLFFFIV